MAMSPRVADLPVITDPAQFDRNSGSWLERFIFNHRALMVLVCVVMTTFLGWHATRLPVNASFEKMIPSSHPYIKHYFENRDTLRGMGNSLRIVLETTDGDIFDKAYLERLQKINDTVFLMPGVDRAWMRSLWTTSLRWTEITEEGYRGGPVMPDRWDGSPAAIRQLQANIARAGIIGSFVADDLKSSMIVVPLIEKDPESGKPLDYAAFSRQLEKQIRAQEGGPYRIHIVGFAKLVGDLIDGLYAVMAYFAVSILIAAVFVFLYTRCWRSTLLLVASAALGVVWLLGIMQLFGFVLDPYSILVPFLIFAIGLSHGAQKMNGIMQDVGRGTHKYVAARYTFRRLFMAGLTALLTNIVGFAVLMIIDIPVIRDMALTTSIGVTVLIFTKLVLIPVLLSYTGVSERAARRSIRVDASVGGGAAAWIRHRLVGLTERRNAIIMIAIAVALAGTALSVRKHIAIGDLSPGAPELRAESRYNRDSAFLTAHYGLANDQFVVMMKTPPGECFAYDNVVEIDRLGAALRQLDGVQTTLSIADGVRRGTSSLFEGNPKWQTISRNTTNRSQAFAIFQGDRPDLADRTCAVTPLVAYLTDHKAGTLTRVMDAVEAFSATHDTPKRAFQLAAGNAGIEAVTNIVVKKSFWTMHFVLYGAVILLCLLTFRSWRATLVAIIPLMLTSILCEALMVWLHIGIKVAVLPVIAVGVGVGVDYALYLLSIQLDLQRQGASLRDAYRGSLDFTGKIVGLVGVTMAAGVVTWVWSPIKFQADMGILLTFMFLWNMIGALMLIPALSHFLLPRVSAKGVSQSDAPVVDDTRRTDITGALRSVTNE
ncbi:MULTISPECIES: efflux RND transporter permease subunit [Pandoraea]|nr:MULTISPECIES: MMPL family transporter [Pandoraea]ALS67942.2 RND transporter [Pandoraea apista]CFB65537.1 MMPL family protein [Pandoraea apista]